MFRPPLWITGARECGGNPVVPAEIPASSESRLLNNTFMKMVRLLIMANILFAILRPSALTAQELKISGSRETVAVPSCEARK